MLDFDELLELAKNYKMTPVEIANQRKSFVIGQMMMMYPTLSKEKVEKIYEETLSC